MVAQSESTFWLMAHERRLTDVMKCITSQKKSLGKAGGTGNWTRTWLTSSRVPTSFLGSLSSLSSASLGRWKKEPGCRWLRDPLWHKLFHRGRLDENSLSISTEAKKMSSLAAHLRANTPLKFNSPFLLQASHRREEIYRPKFNSLQNSQLGISIRLQK